MKTEPLILGMDTNSFGFHLVANQRWEMGRTSWLKAEADDAQSRRAEIFSVCRDLFAKLPGGASLFVEEALVLPKNIETTRKLVMVTGVIEAAFFTAAPNATIFWMPLSSWRKAILGKGSGGKQEMKAMARSFCHRMWGYHGEQLDLTAQDQRAAVYEQEPDLYDAECIMYAGVAALSQGKAVTR